MEESVNSEQTPNKESKGAMIVLLAGAIGGTIGFVLYALGVPGMSVGSESFFAGVGAIIGLIIASIMKKAGKLPNEPSMTRKQKKGW